MVQIYCGEGKGKTTAAVGLAVRAAGRGLRVVFAQFLKSGDSGERTVLAGLLFGALRAGGTAMQAAPGTHIKIVLVLQSTIVLFIAAPPLIRAIFRLPERREPLGATSPSPASVQAAAPAAPAAKEA